jgi:2-oxoglutarate ferredoxin oxidoreductase subunit gamma
MERGLVLSGFGGQGLLFAGQVLAQAALIEGRSVSWLPSYGPEMRGGSAACTVIVADREIGSPILDAADVVIALSPPALAKYEPLVAPGGLLVVNDSLIEAETSRADVVVLLSPCSRLALVGGDDRVISVIALAAALVRRPIVGEVALREALAGLAAKGGPVIVEMNRRALAIGLEHGQPVVAA